MRMGRLVFLKILGGIALLMVLSLGAAILWIQNVPPIPQDEREPASVAQDVFVDRGAVDANQVLMQTSISNSLRARRVSFDSAAMHAALQNPEGTIDLALFADRKVRVRLQNAANHRVNEHLVVGQIDGDSMSRVRLQIFEDSMDGQIEGSRYEFRIAPLGNGQLMIVELRTKNSN